MRRASIIAGLLGIAVGAFAQPAGPGRGSGGPGDFAFIRGEFGITNQVVAGAPYSAEAVTVVTRTLADGNRIQRTTTAAVARDSDGRTRTDRTLDSIGPLAASSGRLKAIFINDPVAGMSYTLDPVRRTARQMPMPARGRLPRVGNLARPQNSAQKEEDLGTQIINGVTAQGKRVTRTIPAGRIGNQNPIDIVTETWYSPDLQVVVMSKTSDPRFGETSYQLNRIMRAEPDRSLFTVPSEYAVEAGPARAR